jgi:hypothetical protein
MKSRIKGELKLMGKEIFAPNRKQGKTHPLCTCSQTKKSHFNNALGHPFKAGSEKNEVEQNYAVDRMGAR